MEIVANYIKANSSINAPLEREHILKHFKQFPEHTKGIATSLNNIKRTKKYTTMIGFIYDESGEIAAYYWISGLNRDDEGHYLTKKDRKRTPVENKKRMREEKRVKKEIRELGIPFSLATETSMTREENGRLQNYRKHLGLHNWIDN